MTYAFCSRCIKYFLHLLFNSLMPTSPASGAVTDWDVSEHKDHFLINHGSSNTASNACPSPLTHDWAINSPRRLLSLPGATLLSKAFFSLLQWDPQLQFQNG